MVKEIKIDNFTAWLLALMEELDYPEVYVNLRAEIVGYRYNKKKKALYFLTSKEAKRLTAKGILWKRLGESW